MWRLPKVKWDMQTSEVKEDKMCDKFVVIRDKYEGLFSDAKWTAWIEEVPVGPEEDDLTCSEFWRDPAYTYGKGVNPEEALENLIQKLDDSFDDG